MTDAQHAWSIECRRLGTCLHRFHRTAEILLGALLALWHAGRPILTGNRRRLAIAIGALGLAGNLYYWFGVSMESAWLWRGGYLIYAATTVAIILGTLQSAGPTHALLR